MLDILGKSTFDEAYEEWCMNDFVCHSKEAFLCNVFNIVTDNDRFENDLGKLIREIIIVIADGNNYDYLCRNESEEDEKNFILVANLLNFKGLIDWGVSIRGCWFNAEAKELIEFCRT